MTLRPRLHGTGATSAPEQKVLQFSLPFTLLRAIRDTSCSCYRNIFDSNVSMYADDTSLCYQSLDSNKLNEVINSDLEKLQKWLMGNKLSLNARKTQSMLSSTKQKHTILRNQDLKLSLKIRDHELEVVDTTKYLGLQIDNSLDWKYHASVLSSKVSKAVGFLKHANLSCL